jgi:hypothetical protein
MDLIEHFFDNECGGALRLAFHDAIIGFSPKLR